MPSYEFAPHTVETAPAASKPILESVKSKYGFIPNLMGTMAESPVLVEAYGTLANIFGKSNLSDTERQIITMTHNRLNGCTYCMAAHTTIAQMEKVPADVIEALRTNTPIADPKLEALRTFTAIINVSRGEPTEVQIEAFLAAGYTKETVFEVIVGTGLKVLSNYTNHIAQTEVDAPFAKHAWSPDLAKAAE